MTVSELLAAIQAAYPGATAEALKSFVPVYHARLRSHEGVRLATAATEVLGTFSATTRKPFPICADFEGHLPSKLEIPRGDGPKIDFDARRERKARLMADWWQRQGHGIESQRGNIIAADCERVAATIAALRAWKDDPVPVLLTAEQIQKCEDCVVSSERNNAYGPYALRRDDGAQWAAQMAECRESVRAGRRIKR